MSLSGLISSGTTVALYLESSISCTFLLHMETSNYESEGLSLCLLIFRTPETDKTPTRTENIWSV